MKFTELPFDGKMASEGARTDKTANPEEISVENIGKAADQRV